MLLQIKQWETKYIRDFDAVKQGVISEELLYQKITAMYYGYITKNSIEPFTIAYGRGQGFCINANSYVGVITYDDIILYINSMIPDLTLGKILYLKSQADSFESDSTTRQVITENLNDEEEIETVDYFVITLLQSVDDIQHNGLLTQLLQVSSTNHNITGHLELSKQIKKHPSFDTFCVSKTQTTENILINQIIKTALIKAKTATKLPWVTPFITSAISAFDNVDILEDLDVAQYPKVSDYTSLKRNDYEQALLFSKYILFGYDPLMGTESSYFPEFMVDMNQVFECYVTTGLTKIFRTGFTAKKKFSLGLGPRDIPIERKNIELDGFYECGDLRVVLDTKNKYRCVLDRDIPDFIASNPDIYQQYYYAGRVNASNIVLVYPSCRKRTDAIGKYDISFTGNKKVNLYFWALHITGSPRQNKKALITLAQFIDDLK